MRSKSAVYPVFDANKTNVVATVGGNTNNGYYNSPEEVQVTKPKDPSLVANTAPVDPWAISQIKPEAVSDGTPWKDMSGCEKTTTVLKNTLKLTVVVCLLYLFVCSLNFLSNSFRLLAGRTTGSVFKNEYMNNPVVGLMIGILVTVLVQSSSTSTSIIVSMVNSGILQVHAAVPMIMGSNIGTSVTNTIVSFTQVGDRNVFRRAFAGATVHDMFNWLSVIVLLSIEVATGLLENLTLKLVEITDWSQITGGKVKLLKVITEPFTKNVIQLDKNVLKHWSLNDPNYFNASLIKKTCGGKPCHFLFANTAMADQTVGLILLLVSLLMLCVALILVVKILSSIMKGSIAQIIRITLNADIPYVPWLTGYIAILIGALMTVLVQSSSIFTSTITPLIGLGLISVERSYPLTLGSNLGTTTTALLASIAGSGDGIKASIQIALVHLFFNIFGLLLFYPIPYMRFPIPLAKGLGNITANYRWFAILYLVLMFMVLPGFVFALSLGGPIALYSVGIPILILLAFICIINIMQEKFPDTLPKILKDWSFVPLPLRSLQPYDRILTSPPCCSSCRQDPLEDLSLPTTVRAVAQPCYNAKTGKFEASLSNRGQIDPSLAEVKQFYSVGPPVEYGTEPTENRRRTEHSAGNVNRGLEVERM